MTIEAIKLARKYTRKLDGWENDIVVSRAEIDAASAALDQQTRRDIEFFHARVKTFAKAQPICSRKIRKLPG